MRLRTRGAVASLAVGIIALALGTAPARAADDPALDQTVAADEEASTESAVIDTGHVDIGPRMVDGQWSVALRDDSGAHPVWRDPDRTVLRVTDAALMAAPTGSDYAFMGAQAGEQYYVVPQTQNPDVVWLGWNTPDPGVVAAIDRGATMRIVSVSGPGRTWMFLQDGTFGKPRLLVDGQSGQAQDVWVDASTHVHANWVFTAPGVYTAALTFSARTTDGQQLSASTTLRFAVGSQTSADEAFAAAPAAAAEAGAPGSADSAGGGGSAAGADRAGERGAGAHRIIRGRDRALRPGDAHHRSRRRRIHHRGPRSRPHHAVEEHRRRAPQSHRGGRRGRGDGRSRRIGRSRGE